MLKSVSSALNAIGALNYAGTWNAATNNPTIVSSTGTQGDYYVVSVAGSTTINGISLWGVGDWIVFNGSIWEKVEGGDTINATTVTASGTITGASFIPTGASVPTNGMFLSAANSLGFATGSTENWVINASGNFNPVGAKGIGTALAPVAGLVTTTLTASGVATLASGAILATPASMTATNVTGLPLTSGVTGTLPVANGGTGVTTSTGTGNVVLSNSPTLVTPALGTPASGAVTNLTGTASININGTVGATTASSVAATTITASSTLAVTGVSTFAAGTVALPAITTTGDTNTGIFFPAADTIAFSEGGAEAMRIDSSGNVGIGTSSPSGKLEVTGANVLLKSTASSGYAGFYANAATGNFSYYFFAVNGTESARIYSDVGNNIGFGTGSSGTERMRIDSNGDFAINAGFGSVGKAYLCRAWVNFNGTGVVAIRGSGNVSSITDNGTGDSTVNFTTAMPDANYCINATGTHDSGSYVAIAYVDNDNSPTTSAVRINFLNATNNPTDASFAQVSIFR